MKSPFPPYAEAELRCQPIVEKYKGEEFSVIEVFWYDPVTEQTFDTTETGDVTVLQIYNAYRVKHGLPFSDELASLRQRLRLSAAKMSAILGLGTNQYRLYEKGDMLVDAVGRYIKMLIGNKSALRDCIENGKGILSANEYRTALAAIEETNDDIASRMLLQRRDKDNGYAPLDVSRMQHVVAHFLNKLGPLSPTCLNKLLFYTDFVSYRKSGMAISGLSYRALPYGPVPNNWKYLPLLAGIDQQEAEIGTLLSTEVPTDYSCFTHAEIETLDSVAERFKGMSATAISELSHQEEAWIQGRKDAKSLISFDYAFSLRAI